MMTTDWGTVVRQLVDTTAARLRPAGPNPLVGAALVADDGSVVATGIHRGAGTAHAEVDAFQAAARSGTDPRGLTIVVTLEPCSHWGRTPPCTEAIIASGVRRVVYAASEPTTAARGGAGALRAHGIEVVGPVDEALGRSLDPRWFSAVALGRPHVTWKTAIALDGSCADAWGRSQWITDDLLRAHGRVLRASHDAIIVGTQTVLDDDPQLTVRDDVDAAYEQPTRVVVGRRDIPAGSAVLDDSAPTVHCRTHDLRHVLDALWERGARRVLLEGGPTIAGAFHAAGLVDELQMHIAPILLTGGRPFVNAAPVALGDAVPFQARSTRQVGSGFVLELTRG